MFLRLMRYGGGLIGRDLHMLLVSHSRRTLGSWSSQRYDEIGR